MSISLTTLSPYPEGLEPSDNHVHKISPYFIYKKKQASSLLLNKEGLNLYRYCRELEINLWPCEHVKTLNKYIEIFNQLVIADSACLIKWKDRFIEIRKKLNSCKISLYDGKRTFLSEVLGENILQFLTKKFKKLNCSQQNKGNNKKVEDGSPIKKEKKSKNCTIKTGNQDSCLDQVPNNDALFSEKKALSLPSIRDLFPDQFANQPFNLAPLRSSRTYRSTQPLPYSRPQRF